MDCPARLSARYSVRARGRVRAIALRPAGDKADAPGSPLGQVGGIRQDTEDLVL